MFETDMKKTGSMLIPIWLYNTNIKKKRHAEELSTTLVNPPRCQGMSDSLSSSFYAQRHKIHSNAVDFDKIHSASHRVA